MRGIFFILTQSRDFSVSQLGKYMFNTQQRVVRNIQAQHFAFKSQLVLLIPLGHIRHLSRKYRTGPDRLSAAVERRKQVKLTGSLITLNPNNLIYQVLMHQV